MAAMQAEHAAHEFIKRRRVMVLGEGERTDFFIVVVVLYVF